MVMPMDFKLPIGSTLRLLRKAAKQSQEEIGRVLILHQSAISRIEQGIQSLTPEQLYLLARHYGVRPGQIMDGDVDYWKVAERFGAVPPIPKRYREFTFTKMRSVLPLVEFMRNNRGQEYVDGMFANMKLNSALVANPDLSIGVNFKLDLARHVIKEGLINKAAVKQLTDFTRMEATQGFLHQVYMTQTVPLHIAQVRILNAHHYSGNFRYEIESLSRNTLDFSVTPNEHMSEVDYKDDVLGDSICAFRKSMFENLPAYIGGKPLQLTEKECHFHGSSRCVYQLSAG